LGNVPFSSQLPTLSSIVNNKTIRVADVLANAPLNIIFRHVLSGERWEAWLDMVEHLMGVQLSNKPCKFSRNLTVLGNFSVKSLYADHMCGHTVFLRKYLCKMRNWTGCKMCAFCDNDETIEHLFIGCTFAKLIWRVVHFTFNMPPPCNITNLFGNWLNRIDKKTMARILTGVYALLWTIWNCRMILYLTKQVVFKFCI
jgi:hypothetical protein